MGSISHAEYLAMKARTEKQQPQPAPTPGTHAAREETLAQDIIGWCKEQWPRWIVLRARPDKASTIAAGAHDLTVFGPWPLCICVELKTKDGKLSPKQLAWATELRMLGWWVAVARSADEFHLAIKEAKERLEIR